VHDIISRISDLPYSMMPDLLKLLYFNRPNNVRWIEYIFQWTCIIVWFQASAAVYMRSSLFWDVTQRRLIVADVSGQPIGPIFNGQAVQEDKPSIYTVWHPKIAKPPNCPIPIFNPCLSLHRPVHKSVKFLKWCIIVSASLNSRLWGRLLLTIPYCLYNMCVAITWFFS
jgi:hypothetical protein